MTDEQEEEEEVRDRDLLFDQKSPDYQFSENISKIYYLTKLSFKVFNYKTFNSAI